MDAGTRNQPAKVTPWKVLVCVAIAIFAAYQRYEWYETGRIYARRSGPEHYVSYAEHPVLFTYASVIYVSAFLLFGGGSLTSRGVVLFRTLVNDEGQVAGIDAARHNAACGPFKVD